MGARYLKDLHIRLTEDQWTFLEEEYEEGGIARHVRKMIDSRRAIHDKELAALEKELGELEPRYFSMKKRIEELREEMKQREDERKTRERRIEGAHEKLLDALKHYNWHPEHIQRVTYRIYADATGLSVQELIDWVNEQAKRRDELE